MKLNILLRQTAVILLPCLILTTVTVQAYQKESKFQKTPTDPELQVFPNPTSGRYNVNLPVGSLRDGSGNETATIDVLDGNGNVIFTETVPLTSDLLTEELYFNQSAPDGIYMVKVTVKNRVFTRQVQLQR